MTASSATAPGSTDPLTEFHRLFDRAREIEPSDATAVALASADDRGRPSVRMVLLKEATGEGFVFFTNYESRKAEHFAANPWAALCFHWPTLERQVRVEGPVARVSAAESDAYFASRPRDSQIGAWASLQSRPLADRETLEHRFEEATRRFAGGEVPRPDTWGGYRLAPERVEIWTGRPHRLHDREVWERQGDCWRTDRLYP